MIREVSQRRIRYQCLASAVLPAAALAYQLAASTTNSSVRNKRPRRGVGHKGQHAPSALRQWPFPAFPPRTVEPRGCTALRNDETHK